GLTNKLYKCYIEPDKAKSLPCDTPNVLLVRLYGAGTEVFFSRENETKIFKKFAERSEEHTSELQSRENLVCRLLLEKKKGLVLNTTTTGAAGKPSINYSNNLSFQTPDKQFATSPNHDMTYSAGPLERQGETLKRSF